MSDCENRKRWKKMTLRFTQQEYNEITEAAAASGRTLSDFVLYLLRNKQMQDLESELGIK